MVANNPIHVNECGLPLNSVEWLETHHRSKQPEREQMLDDLQIQEGGLVVDAGCGPGLWIPLLAKYIGSTGKIIGVDIAVEALVAAQKRSAESGFQNQVEYKRAVLEKLPLAPGSADIIFSANVSQYLANPVRTFAAMGPFLRPGGRLIIKDLDFGTIRFHNVDDSLQNRVFEARKRWETYRTNNNYSFEDSWVGSKLAGYLREAGFETVVEKKYRIARSYPLSPDAHFYIKGISEWFVSEDAPYLSRKDYEAWVHAFFDHHDNVLRRSDFSCEETEFIVSGVWTQTPATRKMHFDMHIHAHDEGSI